MNKNISITLFAIILLTGIVLRFYQLGSVPISPNWDEVALAYDAHSLLLTGKDEYGEFLPWVLRSFDDYKPALYAYLAIPWVALFGMTPFAVRLPSAIMGTIAIIAAYFLVKELFFSNPKSVARPPKQNDKNTKKLLDFRNWKLEIPLLVAALMAISPWHMHFSRIAFESNVGLTFNILAALFFLKGLKKPWLLLLAALFAGLNLSVYQSERVFTPLLFLALILIYRKELFALPKRYLAASVVVGVLAVAPLVLYITTHEQALVRIKATSVFSQQTQLLERTITRLADDKARNDILGLVLDNRRIIYAKTVAGSYLSHYDPNWLFMTGDINRHHAPRMGLLYIVFLPFVLIGIYQLIFGNFDRKTKYFVFAWFLIAPIPASVTYEVPHAVRTLNVLLVYQIFIALGTVAFVSAITRLRMLQPLLQYAVFGFLTLLFSLNFVYYLNQYFVQQNYFYAYDWQYGYEKAVPVVEAMKKDYKKVIVSDRQPLDKSYMFFLYYLKYPPQEYQKIGVTSSGNFARTHHFDKYEFRLFNWDEEKKTRDVLFVGSPADFSGGMKGEEIIYYPNGEPAILIVDPEKHQ